MYLSLLRIGNYVGQEVAQSLVEEFKVRELIDRSENRSQALVAFVKEFGVKLVSELFRGTNTKVQVEIDSENSKIQLEFQTRRQQ